MQRFLVAFLYEIAIAAVPTWSNTHDFLKPTGKMALIGLGTGLTVIVFFKPLVTIAKGLMSGYF